MNRIDQLIQGFTDALSKLGARPIPLEKERITEIAQQLIHQSGVDEHGFLDQKSSVEFVETDMTGNKILAVITLQPAHEMLGMDGDPAASVDADVRKFISPEATQEIRSNPDVAQLLDEKGVEGMALIGIRINDFNLGQILGLINIDIVPYGPMPQTKIEVGESGEGLSDTEYEKLAEARLETITSAIAHELTHVKDPEAGQATYQEAGRTEDETAYVSQPVEVRAFMQQLIQELNSIHQPGEDLFDVLNRSTTWAMLAPNLNDEAKKKLLQSVYTWFVEKNQ